MGGALGGYGNFRVPEMRRNRLAVLIIFHVHSISGMAGLIEHMFDFVDKYRWQRLVSSAVEESSAETAWESHAVGAASGALGIRRWNPAVVAAGWWIPPSSPGVKRHQPPSSLSPRTPGRRRPRRPLNTVTA